MIFERFSRWAKLVKRPLEYILLFVSFCLMVFLVWYFFSVLPSRYRAVAVIEGSDSDCPMCKACPHCPVCPAAPLVICPICPICQENVLSEDRNIAAHVILEENYQRLKKGSCCSFSRPQLRDMCAQVLHAPEFSRTWVYYLDVLKFDGNFTFLEWSVKLDRLTNLECLDGCLMDNKVAVDYLVEQQRLMEHYLRPP